MLRLAGALGSVASSAERSNLQIPAYSEATFRSTATGSTSKYSSEVAYLLAYPPMTDLPTLTSLSTYSTYSAYLQHQHTYDLPV